MKATISFACLAFVIVRTIGQSQTTMNNAASHLTATQQQELSVLQLRITQNLEELSRAERVLLAGGTFDFEPTSRLGVENLILFTILPITDIDPAPTYDCLSQLNETAHCIVKFATESAGDCFRRVKVALNQLLNQTRAVTYAEKLERIEHKVIRYDSLKKGFQVRCYNHVYGTAYRQVNEVLLPKTKCAYEKTKRDMIIEKLKKSMNKERTTTPYYNYRSNLMYQQNDNGDVLL